MTSAKSLKGPGLNFAFCEKQTQWYEPHPGQAIIINIRVKGASQSAWDEKDKALSTQEKALWYSVNHSETEAQETDVLWNTTGTYTMYVYHRSDILSICI